MSTIYFSLLLIVCIEIAPFRKLMCMQKTDLIQETKKNEKKKMGDERHKQRHIGVNGWPITPNRWKIGKLLHKRNEANSERRKRHSITHTITTLDPFYK